MMFTLVLVLIVAATLFGCLLVLALGNAPRGRTLEQDEQSVRELILMDGLEGEDWEKWGPEP
jgi:hypothetical protein